jgi:truncated hemoglobin YjbI
MSVRSDVRDIEDRADCERLVRAFYGRALTDPMIGWIFVDVARLDVEAHVPVIASFWETILLGAGSYRGGAFAPHAALHAKVPLRAGHFERWLVLWRGTVDELFAARARSWPRPMPSGWRAPSTGACTASPTRTSTPAPRRSRGPHDRPVRLLSSRPQSLRRAGSAR